MKRQLQTTLDSLIDKLQQNYNSQTGFWQSSLSDSALATAVTTFALYSVDKQKYAPQINNAISWLGNTINPDGGWGDTPQSKSNLSTTLLCWATLNIAQKTKQLIDIEKQSSNYIKKIAGTLKISNISQAVLKHYGNDLTFSVPILTMCLLAGRFANEKNPWKYIPQLPFEFATLPQATFSLLHLPVVSYAIPALIAVGLVQHKQKPTKILPLRWIRNLCQNRCLQKLKQMQPTSGGFLEAAPLTAFVIICLSFSQQKQNLVVKQGVKFLLQSIRKNGSIPIDTDLNIWCTTLAINALTTNHISSLSTEQNKQLQNSLLEKQYKHIHPFTAAAAGGWAWTDKSGAVPDADDTAGALLAIHNLNKNNAQIKDAAKNAINWLLTIQNKDGGIPTFCRGWGKLKFDKSSPDISAHTLHAFTIWQKLLDVSQQQKVKIAKQKIIIYLKNCQQPNGSWIPLWFGNQHHPQNKNPLYGTAKTIIALQQQEHNTQIKTMLKNGVGWLLANQNQDQGWGANKNLPSTIEETALAITALADKKYQKQIKQAIQWLITNINNQQTILAKPIGLYFATLWYSEKLYPIIFSITAIKTSQQILTSKTCQNTPSEISFVGEKL